MRGNSLTPESESMNGKSILISSSAVLALAGLAASFAPAELLRALGSSDTGPTVAVVQLLGALYLAFAFVNWTAKENPIGGIYSRPIALGNLTHFLMGALSLVKLYVAGQKSVAVAAMVVVYAIFAILFARLFFGSGLKKS